MPRYFHPGALRKSCRVEPGANHMQQIPAAAAAPTGQMPGQAHATTITRSVISPCCSAHRRKRCPSRVSMVLGTAIAFLCQATDVQGRTVKSLLELRQDNVVVQKWDLSCGAAALATILNYEFGDRVTEREITAYLIRRPEYLSAPEIIRVRQGFSMLDLKRYVESRGYKGSANSAPRRKGTRMLACDVATTA